MFLEILGKISALMTNYPNPVRFWLGPQLLICFSEPSDVEKILTSSKFSYKHEMYDFLKTFLGEGLVTASGILIF